MPAASPVLRCLKLGKTYDEGGLRTPVFDGLDLEVQAGETVAIVGASGVGKSTLLHLLGGLDTPSSGEVEVAGARMSSLGQRERGALRNRALGFIYQFHHLLPEFTALENVMMPLRIGGRSAAEAWVLHATPAWTRAHLEEPKEVVAAANNGVAVVGICNGFQVLTEVGLLPGALLRNAG